jgi:glycosyltransferase involved in cell wall biosynthesis
MVIEAKLLGCDLILNEFVLHSNEQWFSNNEQIYDYLFASPNYFWTIIDSNMTYKASISGYTTVLNCNNQQYPFKQCIQSMLDFCDEVCVVDGGSTDGTYEELVEWANKEPKIVLKQVTRDWSSPRYAVFDGMQKAEARSMCTKEFCWQMDCDEIVHEKDYAKIFDMCKSLPHDIDVISLPVVEYWGSYEKVRVDIQPWKWRLSRNNPDITHGIPSELRKYDKEGNLFAMPGTDGCDMISKSSGERIPHLSFYRQEVEEARHAAMDGNQAALGAYNAWFNEVINNLPSVYHYSWFNLDRKIKLYKNYWTKHWLSLWNCDLGDTSENNMFFDMPWAEVTEASSRSGTLNTAKHALEQGKDVFVVPGNITSPSSAGCNALLKQGAIPVTEVDDILARIAPMLNTSQTQLPLGANSLQTKIIKLLQSGVRDGDQLQEKLALPIHELSGELTMMEIEGTVRALGANQWTLR